VAQRLHHSQPLFRGYQKADPNLSNLLLAPFFAKQIESAQASWRRVVAKAVENIKALLTEYASYKLSFGEVDTDVVIDPIGDHYQLMHVGWDHQKRIYGLVLHFDIKDGKIWIQYNGTE
jgi:hypothetical protein